MRPMKRLEWYSPALLPWPVDWADHFGRKASLWVEIGFGNGQYLAHIAQQRPEINFLGIEISLPSLRNAARKVRIMGLQNVALLQSTAEAALQLLCLPGSVAGVTINFPDPWPKKDHQARRLIDGSFLALLASRLALGGHLDIATDHAEYATSIAECLEQSQYFVSRDNAPFLHHDPERLQTKYEGRALAAGRPCYYFRRRRNAVPSDEFFPIPQEYSMPHLIMRLPVELRDIGRRLEPEVILAGDARIKFLEVYESLRDGKLLVETYVNEEPLRQRVTLMIRARPPDEIIISLHEMGFPRATRGIHQAIEQLGRRLQELFPSAEIVSGTLKIT